MKWTDFPYTVRLLAGILVGVLILKLGCALISFLVRISVHDHPPNTKGPKFERYMLLSGLRKFFLSIFYVGILLELIFLPFVVNHISNASVGHLILSGFFIVIGMAGNIAGIIKQKHLKC